jgi:hypothetical protein
MRKENNNKLDTVQCQMNEVSDKFVDKFIQQYLHSGYHKPGSQ